MPRKTHYSWVQSSTVHYSPEQSNIFQYCQVQSFTFQYSPVQPNTVQYSPVLPSTTQYSLVQSITVHYSPVQFSRACHPSKTGWGCLRLQKWGAPFNFGKMAIPQSNGLFWGLKHFNFSHPHRPNIYKICILQEEMVQNDQPSPQQWSEDNTAANMGSPPPTRWWLQRSNSLYKEHLDGQLTTYLTNPAIFLLPGMSLI